MGNRNQKEDNTMTIQELAEQVCAAREMRHRMGLEVETGIYADGGTFYALRKGSPEWMRDLMRAAHRDGDIFPDDWRYACAFAACEAIAECEDGAHLDERGHDFADAYVDTYTHDLTAWLASSNHRVGYVDEAREYYGNDGEWTMDYALPMGQYVEAREVFDAVVEYLAERVEVTI
jgi:hypothetical protein